MKGWTWPLVTIFNLNRERDGVREREDSEKREERKERRCGEVERK